MVELVLVSDAADHFTERDGERFAGEHFLVDLFDASRLNNPDTIDAILRDVVSVAETTILHAHFHHFGDGGGVSGVIVLIKGHITIHTWPERGFAAIDIFLSGGDPRKCMSIIRHGFKPGRITVAQERRGRIS